MHTANLYIPERNRPYRLVPFMLVALLLHGIALLWIHPKAPAVAHRPHPLIVELALPDRPAISLPAVPTKSSAVKREATPPRQKIDAASPLPAIPLDSARILSSARQFARDQEKRILQEERKRAETPIGLLEQGLRQAHAETRFANSVLKITTSSGTTYCLQPPPHFVQNTSAAALYNIPMTCP